MGLTEAQETAFERDGYLANVPVASPSEASQYRKVFDEIESREGREKCQKGLYDPHFNEQFVWDMATNPAILNAIESLIGSNLLLMGTHFFCKYGPTDAFVAWHQDVTYWGLEPPKAVSAWYAVDDSDAGNGCLQVIPGSHHAGVRAHDKSDVDGNLLSINQELKVSEDEAKEVVNVELKAGEISLHHGLVVHGSVPNRSQRRRCGLAMVYIPTSVRQSEENSLRSTWKALLVRGENTEEYFENSPHPFPIRWSAVSPAG